MDRIFMWWPHVRSSATRKLTPTWQDVKLAAKGKDPPMKLNTSLEQNSPEKDVNRMVNAHNSSSSCVRQDDAENDDYVDGDNSPEKDVNMRVKAHNSSFSCVRQDDDAENDDSFDDDVEASSDKVFDPHIPDVDSLCGPQYRRGGRLSSCSKSSLEDNEEEWNIF